jgi:hypothetical protein
MKILDPRTGVLPRLPVRRRQRLIPQLLVEQRLEVRVLKREIE